MAGNNLTLDDILAARGQNAQQNLVAGEETSPEDAVTGLRDGPPLGVPPQLASQTAAQVRQIAQQRKNTEILSQSPATAGLVASSPVKAAAVKDDLAGLAKVARQIGSTFATLNGNPIEDFAYGVTNAGQSIINDVTQIGQNIGRPDIGSTVKAFAGLAKLPIDTAAAPFGGPMALITEPLSRIYSAALNVPLERGRHDIGVAMLGMRPRFPGTAVGPVGGTAIPSEAAAVRPPAPPSPEGLHPTDSNGFVLAPDGQPASFATPQDAAKWKREQAKEGNHIAGEPDLHPDTGEIGFRVYRPQGQDVPVPGMDAGTDSLYQSAAMESEARLKAAEEAVVETKTHARDPALMEDFIENHVAPEQTVSVDPEAIVKIWKEGDFAPFADDPELHAQVMDALQNGHQVEIALSKYLAEVSGQPFADALRPAVAVGDGISSEQAKELPRVVVPPDALEPLYGTDKFGELLHAISKADLFHLEDREIIAHLNDLLSHPHDLTPSQEKFLSSMENLGVIPRGETSSESPSEAIAKAQPEIDEDTLAALADAGFSPTDYENFAKGNVPEPEGLSLEDLDSHEREQFNAARAAVKVAAKQAREMFLKSLFKDPASLGMTAKQYAGYAKRVHEGYNELVQKLWKKTFENVKGQYTKEWKDAWHKNFSEVTDELMSEPAIRAAHEFRFSKAEIDELAKETKLVDENGKPITFYHASSHFNVGTPENPWRPHNYDGISFGYGPEFPQSFHSFDMFNPYHVAHDYDYQEQQGQRKTLYIVNLLSKNPGDFRKPADVDKAARWYAEQQWKFLEKSPTNLKYRLQELGLEPLINAKTKELFIEREKHTHMEQLSGGYYGVWENGQMMRDLGWDAIHMKEYAGAKHLNIFVLDGKQVYFRFRENTSVPAVRLHSDVKKEFPEALWKHLPKSYFSKEGRPATEVAAKFGFDSPETMLRELSQLEVARGGENFRAFIKDSISKATRQRTLDDVGDILNPDRILQDAKALFSSPQAIDLLNVEFKELAKNEVSPKRPDGLPFTKEDVEKMALDSFSRMPMKRAVNLRNFEGSIKRWGDRAEEAMVKGKPDFLAAFSAKQKQIINVHQLAAAHELQHTLRVVGKKFGDYAKHRAIPGMAQDYLDAIHAELQQHDYAVPQANLEYNYEKFYTEEMKKGNFALALPDVIPKGKLKNLTVDQFQALVERITTLAKSGRVAEAITIQGRKVKMELLRQEALAGAPPKPDRDFGVKVKANYLDKAYFGIRAPEMVYRELDQRNPTGTFTRVLHWGARDADALRTNIRKEIVEPAQELLNKLPNRIRARWAEPVPKGHGLIDPWTKKEMSLSKVDLLGIVLNMGSEQNRWHLEEGGMGWKPEQYQAAIEKHLSLEDVRFAQNLLDEVGKLWPRIADTTKAVTDLAPAKVPATKFTLFGEDFKGGYWPLVRDAMRNPPGHWEEVTVDSFARGMVEARTANGFTKRRTWARYYPSLDWNRVLFDHLNKVSTYVAYAPWVQEANAFLQDPVIDRIIKNVLGPEGPKYMRDILKQQIGARNAETGIMQAASGFLRGVREHTYMAEAGLNIKVMAEHLVAIPQTIAAIGGPYTARGYGRLLWDWGHPTFGGKKPLGWEGGLINRVHAMSPFMDQRMMGVNALLREIYEDIHTDISLQPKNVFTIIDKVILDKIRAFSHGVISGINHYFIAIPAWWGGYTKALKAGYEPSDAIRIADGVVSQSHGSSSPADLPPILATNAVFKTFTYYMQYHVRLLNQALEAGQIMAGGKDWKDRLDAIRQGFWLMVATVLVTGLATDKYHKAEDVWNTLGEGVLSNLMGGAPFMRDFKDDLDKSPAQVRYNGVAQVPFLREFANLAATGEEDFAALEKMVNIHTKVKVPKNWIMNNVEAVGFLFNLPAVQPGRTLQVAHDMAQHPVQRPAAALLFGPSHERPKR